MVLTLITHSWCRYYYHSSFENTIDMSDVYSASSFQHVYAIDVRSKQNTYGGKRYIPWC